ncbi:hypothetical protein C8Q70DRAFT_1005933 [Cubamyces menziesii]|nr:hypothetical protein C8Q70DRAFT_1005933 [Cubamyces menziesii]
MRYYAYYSAAGRRQPPSPTQRPRHHNVGIRRTSGRRACQDHSEGDIAKGDMYQRTASRQMLAPRGGSSQTALPNCIRLGIIRKKATTSLRRSEKRNVLTITGQYHHRASSSST